MKRLTRGPAVLLAAAFASTAALGVAAPAMASSPSSQVPAATACPDKASSTFGEFEYARSHGTSVDEYYAGNGTAMQVFRVDGHYEVYGTNGAAIGRICYDKQPPRLDNIKPAEQQLVGGGGGGSAIGHVVHGVNANLLITTKWVKWTVRVG
ncbi:hypothetical protein L2X99_06420 [Microbacterium sp. KUDC0406]|uniref:hypothetical protein n=1 Tax=Microbacterium sp. KUDC0406 TaxID=2909588 RepID=UPI001F44070D|nr:hypothetical protein [Microbacterium sp. KUDC0406]UJP11188.1 hypothetical protein L2X99_06420 [Microbacterium sp. KUDC0406]